MARHGPMQMHPVRSSNVAAIGHDPDSQILTVQFHSGRSYRYANVSEEVFEQFLDAESKGRFFNEHIKDVYAETTASPVTSQA